MRYFESLFRAATLRLQIATRLQPVRSTSQHFIHGEEATKAKWALIFIAASTFGAVCEQTSAQVAGAQPIGVSVEEAALVINGWSVNKSLLGKPIYNDQGAKVGVLHDIIISPDNDASFAIVAAHQFLGVSRHDVAIPMAHSTMRAASSCGPARTAMR